MKDAWGPASDAIAVSSDVIGLPQEILGDDAQGRDARSRSIGVNWITCHCLHHKAAQHHRDQWTLCWAAHSFVYYCNVCSLTSDACHFSNRFGPLLRSIR